MEQRISLITLGVNDLAASKKFFEGLGWKTAGEQWEGVCFFQLGGVVLSLYPMQNLLADQSLTGEIPASGGITIGYNTRSQEEVSEIMDRVVALGGSIIARPKETPWGAITGYFADLDGHSWEVTWLPDNPPQADGAVVIK